MSCQFNKCIRSPFLWMGVLLLICTFLYERVAGFGFITGADQDMITRNPLLNTLAGIDAGKILSSPVAGSYQPMAMLTLAIDMTIMPQSPSKVIHLGNLFLHLLNVSLFFSLARRLLRNGYAALLIAGVMALHPMNTGAVAWMSSRGLLLGTALMLAGALIYVHIQDKPGRRTFFRIILSMSFILALLSHPLAIIFPMGLILIDMWRGQSLLTAVKDKIFLLIVAAIFLFISVTLYHSPIPGQDFSDRLTYIFYSTGMGLLHFFVPYNSSPLGVFPENLVFALFGLAFIGAMFAGAFILQRKTGLKVPLPMIFYTVALAIAMFTDLRSESGAGIEGMYVAGFGLAVMMGVLPGYFIKRYAQSNVMKYIAMVLPVSFLAVLTVLTWSRLDIWQDGETYWSEVIRHHPDHAQAFFLRGDHYALNGNFEKAQFDYQQCIRRDPGAYMAMNNLGLIFLGENDLPMALAQFDRSITVRDNVYMSRMNRGICLMRLGRNEEALESMNVAIALEPKESLIYYNRGLVHERLNALENAIGDFSKAIALNPDMLQFYKDRGKAYTWMKDFESAEKDYTIILERDPSNAEMWFRRSLARSSRNQFKGALEDALKARSLGFPVEEEYIRGISVQAFSEDLPAEGK